MSLGHGVNEFFSIAIPPVIPLLVTDFGITYAQAGLLLTVFFVMYSVFQLPAGIIADWIGKKRILVAGLAGMSVGVFIAGVAMSYEALIVAQVIAGISGSTLHPTGMSLISDIETPRTEGKAMGVWNFGGTAGTMAAPIIIGGIALYGDWRLALGVAAVIGGLVTLLFVFLFRDTNTTARLASLPPAHESNPGDPNDTARDSVSFRDRAHSVYETVKIPLTTGILIMFIITFFLALQLRAIHTFTTSFIAAETDGSVAVGNLAFFALLLGGTVASIVAGDLADRVDRGILGILTAVGTGVLIAGTLLIARIIDGFPSLVVSSVFMIWLFFIGVMLYAHFPIANAIVSDQAEQEFSGGLFGLMQTAAAIGGGIGPAVFGVLASSVGVMAAYPLIAFVSIGPGGLFLYYHYLDRTDALHYQHGSRAEH